MRPDSRTHISNKIVQEEPYKMTLFGKDMDELEVVAADFLPDGKRLYMVVADADSDLYILQYDPEGTCPIHLLQDSELCQKLTSTICRSQVFKRRPTSQPQPLSRWTLPPDGHSSSAHAGIF